MGALSIGIHRQLTVLLPLGNFPVRFPSHVFSVSIRHKLVLALPMLLLYPALRVGINSCAIGFSSVGLGFVQVNSQQRVPIVLCSVSRARLHTAQIPSTHCCVCVCARRTPLSPRVPRALVGRGDFPFSIPALLTSMSDIRTNVLLPTIFDPARHPLSVCKHVSFLIPSKCMLPQLVRAAFYALAMYVVHCSAFNSCT